MILEIVVMIIVFVIMFFSAHNRHQAQIDTTPLVATTMVAAIVPTLAATTSVSTVEQPQSQSSSCESVSPSSSYEQTSTRESSAADLSQISQPMTGASSSRSAFARKDKHSCARKMVTFNERTHVRLINVNNGEIVQQYTRTT